MFSDVSTARTKARKRTAGIVYSCGFFGIKCHLELMNEESKRSNVGVGKEDEMKLLAKQVLTIVHSSPFPTPTLDLLLSSLISSK